MKQFHSIIKDILYFESDNRKINIYTTKGQISFYGILSEVLEELDEFDFLFIHQSYIVNYNHIISFEYNQVTMSNDTILPISQSRRKIIREQQLNLARKGI